MPILYRMPPAALAPTQLLLHTRLLSQYIPPMHSTMLGWTAQVEWDARFLVATEIFLSVGWFERDITFTKLWHIRI